jgi:hypothetical protein
MLPLYKKLKVKCSVYRVDRGTALSFLDLGARRWLMVSTTPRPLYPRERPGTRCTGGWVGPRAGLDVCEKSHPHRDSIPGPSSPQPVTIPTELPGPRSHYISHLNVNTIILYLWFPYRCVISNSGVIYCPTQHVECCVGQYIVYSIV